MDRIDLIKQVCNKLQSRPATNKADKKIALLVDSVIKSEYCKASANSEKRNELDFND